MEKDDFKFRTILNKADKFQRRILKRKSLLTIGQIGNISYKTVGRAMFSNEARFTFRGSNGWSYYFHDLRKRV